MKIVDLGGIDVGERSGEDVRLFLVVALQTDAVAGPNHRFKEIPQIHDFDSLARSVPASVGEALRQGSLLCVPALHSSSLLFWWPSFRGTGMKSIDPAHRTETEIATSTLLRIAFEYGQIA